MNTANLMIEQVNGVLIPMIDFQPTTTITTNKVEATNNSAKDEPVCLCGSVFVAVFFGGIFSCFTSNRFTITSLDVTVTVVFLLF